MRTRSGMILAAAVALAVGAAAGWFAARAWGSAAVSSKPPYRDATSREDNIGRARSMNAPNGSVASPHATDADAKPRRKALIRSLAGAEVQKRILENKISYLEKCIAAAKGGDAKPAEKSTRQTPSWLSG